MKKVSMLCLGLKKNLSSLRLQLTAHDMAWRSAPMISVRPISYSGAPHIEEDNFL